MLDNWSETHNNPDCLERRSGQRCLDNRGSTCIKKAGNGTACVRKMELCLPACNTLALDSCLHWLSSHSLSLHRCDMFLVLKGFTENIELLHHTLYYNFVWVIQLIKDVGVFTCDRCRFVWLHASCTCLLCSRVTACYAHWKAWSHGLIGLINEV